MMKLLKISAFAVLTSLALPQLAAAQNTGGVFPPMVNDGHKSAQYRIAINPNNAADGVNLQTRGQIARKLENG